LTSSLDTGDSFLDFERDDLESKYQHVSMETAEAEWRAAYEHSMDNCTHGPGCKQVGEACVSVCSQARVQAVLIRWGCADAVWWPRLLALFHCCAT